MRVSRCFLLQCLAGLALVGCGAPTLDDVRKAEIVNVMVLADEPLLRTRPNLVAGKYARMASNPYDFFRGTVPLSWHDYQNNRFDLGNSSFSLDGPLAPILGDPHPENFGTLLGADGTLGLEPNDFDGAEFAPYLWDLRRLTTGMALVARLTNPDDAAAREVTAQASREIARTAADAYARAILALSGGTERQRITSAKDDPILDDMFSRAQIGLADRTELTASTSLESGRRVLLRGVLDPLEPTARHIDLPAWAYAAIPDTLRRYRESLLNPPEPAYFNLLDAVRVLGSGVASWARLRVVLLVRGSTDDPGDDVLLELKELSDGGLGGHYPPFTRYDNVQERIRVTSRAAWATAAAEPLWGTSEWLGFPCQIKRESDAHKTIRVRRMSEERGTPEALLSLARHLGEVLARAHAATPKNAEWVVRDIAYVIQRDLVRFADEQADVGDRYAQRVLADYELFRLALEDFGPRLGLPVDEIDVVNPELAALYADEQAK